MPPLQQTIFDSASPIPFADNTPFSNVFDTDIFAPSSQTPPPKPYDTPLTTLAPMPTVSEPTSEDIAALFGVPPLPSITPSIPVATPAVAPPAHYSSLPHHLAQEKSPIAPIPASPTLYEPPQKTSLVVPLSLNKPHRYPSYNTYNQQEQYSEQQYQYSEQPQHQYFEQNTQYQRNNTTNNAETYNYNVNGYSVYTTDDYSQPESGLATKPADPFMLNPSKPSIFSRFSNSNGGVGFGTTPNLAKAVSYMSSTLAVTSTFATEKLATASTKIADLWQHNQTLLPQQQHSQQLQQPSQDQYNNYYDTTINSGPYYHDNKEQPSSYETGYGPVSGANYVHSDINNHNNSTSNYSPTFGDTKQPPPYEYQPYQQQQHQQQQQQQKQQQQLYQQSTGGSFAETATSTLSNAATVATSYLPNLSKLPALKSLPALPALPWGSRNKGLPQQQPSQYQQQYQGSESYSFGQPEQQHQQPQYAQDAHQPFSNYNYSYSEQIGQGGGRLLAGTGELLQKGRQMVQTGAQAGVAWWWGADSKNSMSVV